MNLCDDCRKPLVDPNKCSLCGWVRSKPSKTVDHSCAYQSRGRRCPAGGSARKGADWYCRWHYPILSDSRACEEVLADLLANGIPEDDWRKQIVDERLNKMGLERLPGEMPRIHAMRCKDYARQNFGSLMRVVEREPGEDG